MGRLFFCLFLAVSLVGCKWGEGNKLPDPSTRRLPEASDAAVYRSMDAFAADLLAQLETGDNVVISPVSVEQLLAVLMNGASGQTRTELLSVLGTNEDGREGFNESQRALLNAFKKGGEVQVANAVFTVWPVVLDTFYVTSMGESYDAAVKKLGSAGLGAVDVANGWVSSHTAGRIPGVFESFSPDEALVAASAFHFGADWEHPFDPARAGRFASPHGTVDAQFMSVLERFAYASGEGWQYVSLPYQGGEYAMELVLSDSPFSALSRIEQMRSVAVEAEVLVVLPKFDFDANVDLVPLVQEMGVPSLFNDKCNLRIMSVEMESGYRFSRILHRAVVRVDELGTEAAAVSAGVAEGKEVSGLSFVADRPFTFIVRHVKTGVVCVTGVVNNPSAQ